MIEPMMASDPAFARHDMGVSAFWREASPEEQASQRAWQSELAARADMRFGEEAFVSALAVVYPDRLVLGDRSYVSGHAYLWGDVEIGADCTLNPFTEVRGKITIGDGVRIGAHTSILGFNHSADADRPIWQQPLQFAGIVIGDDVWIGSHVVVLDGVSIGSHSIVGAGAVVTKDVAPWSIVVGNPARKVRDRRDSAAPKAPEGLAALIDEVRGDLPGILEASWDGDRFVNHPGAEPTVRAWCDAVELAHLYESPLPLPAADDRIVSELLSRQDGSTGLIPDWSATSADASPDGHAGVNYHVLSAGYALRLLGARFAHPIRSVQQLSSADLVATLDGLDWRTEGWRAGAWVDALGTAMVWNRDNFGLEVEIEAVFGWLLTRCNPVTGLWGVPDAASGWLEPVNGFYRLTRGTFAQFGIPLPYPERTIDSVLAHAGDKNYFADGRGTACNVLDVIHPLWLAGKQTPHRRAEGEEWARRQLARVVRSWTPQRGFSFALQEGEGWRRAPGLLGTEMWLSITWLLADYLGMADVLDFRPRGVHRPSPLAGPTSARA